MKTIPSLTTPVAEDSEMFFCLLFPFPPFPPIFTSFSLPSAAGNLLEQRMLIFRCVKKGGGGGAGYCSQHKSYLWHWSDKTKVTGVLIPRLQYCPVIIMICWSILSWSPSTCTLYLNGT